MKTKTYDDAFFTGLASGSLQSARIVLAILNEIVQPRSVVDVGCGVGAWLTAAGELGADRLVGFDGPWVTPAQLMTKTIEFSPVDLGREFPISEHYDLAISLEVAEHLPVESARSFVEKLCSASELIVFSAAIHLQGGTSHINEQWQSYWANLFAEQGFESCDLFRPRIWTDQRVESWYRQNVLLFFKSGHPASEAPRAAEPRRTPLDLVHPEIYEGNMENQSRQIARPSLAFCARIMGRWAALKIQGLLGKRKEAIATSNPAPESSKL